MKRRIASHRFLFLLVVLVSYCCAIDRIVFIGLSGEGAPAIEQTFDRLLREQLTVIPDCAVADYVETLRYRKMIDFNRYPVVSEQFVTELQKLIPDAALIIWGSIKKMSIKPVRRTLINAIAEGELTVGLTVYNLTQGTFAYSGDVKGAAKKREGFVFFSSVDKVTHIPASDRAELTEQIVNDAVLASASIIRSILRSENLQFAGTVKGDTGKGRSPSISDVFTVPSVAPHEIQDNPPLITPDSGNTKKNVSPPPDKNKTSTGTK